MNYLFKFTLFLLAYAFLSSLILAQSGKNLITVSVSDVLGSKIPDANVVLYEGSKKIDEKKTNKQGTVIFEVNNSSKFSISISAKGFKQYLINDINFDKINKQSYVAVLEIEPIQVDINVGENDEVNSDDFGRKTILGKEEINDLPNDPDMLLTRLLEIAGVKDKDDIVISVNGVTGTDIPPKARIKQIRINQNVFSAQYEGTSTASIEITTNAFVEKIQSYFIYSFGSSALNAASPYLGRREPFKQDSFRMGTSIPTWKKSSISIDGRYLSDLSGSTVTATILDEKLLPKALRQSFSTPKYNEYISFEFDSDAIKNHQIILKQAVNQDRRNGIGVGGFNLSSRAADSNARLFTTLFSDIYTPNPNFFSQTTFLGNFSSNKTKNKSSEVGINVTDSFFGGGSAKNENQTETKLKISNDSLKKYGSYTMSFGFQLQWQKMDEDTRSNFNGTYFFSGKTAPKLDSNDLPILDNSGNYINEQISSLENYRRTLIFQQFGFSKNKIRELGGGAEQFSISGGTSAISASQTEYAFYQQNSIGIGETLGLSFGIRYENQTNINSRLNLSPRFGFTWRPKSKDKINPFFALPAIRGGFGIFYSRFGFDKTLNFQRINDVNRFSYTVSDANLLDMFPNPISVLDLQQLSIPKSRLLFDAKLQTPRKEIVNINIIQPLPAKISLSFNLDFVKASRLAITTNINSPLPQTYNFTNQTGEIFPFGTNETILKTESKGKSNSFKITAVLSVPRLKLFKEATVQPRVFYYLEKSHSNAVDASSSPFNAYNFNNEYGPDENDGVHTLSFNCQFNLPHSITLSGMFNIRNGLRFNIITGQDTNGDGFYAERPAYSTNPNKIGVIKTKYGLLDPNPSSNDLIIPRNFGQGSLQKNFNAFIYKRFEFNEDKKSKQDPKQMLIIRLDVSNVFNTNNKSIPIGNMSSPNFLESLNNFSDSNPRNDSRRLTLGAIFYF